MSLFTNEAYAPFLGRQPPPRVGSAPQLEQSDASKLKHPAVQSLAVHPAALAGHHRPASADVSSSRQQADVSAFDPLSQANLARAADPWYDNSFVSAPAESRSISGAVAPGATLTSVNTNSLKTLDDPKDDEWGEFVTFASPSEERREARLTRSPEKRSTSESRRAPVSRRQERPTDHESTPDRYSASSYEYTRAPFTVQSSMPNLRSQRATGSFSDLLLARLSSLTSSPRAGGMNNRSSSLGSLFSFSGGSSPPEGAPPPRNYDSYDVTFERGPIGLELETDWYGRQAVVKGFKRVNNGKDDGPAKACGIIRIGDVLTAINGESCLEMSFSDTLAKLRDVSNGRHELHFKSLEAAGDLSVFSHAPDIVQAKKFIHQHKEKFYRAPSGRRRDLILGCVERLRGPTVTAFNFHREDTGEFLLACSCVNEATGLFLFHTLQDSHLREFKDLPQSEDSAVYLGQMTPSFLGTEFTLLDHQQKRRNELGFLEYSSNVLGRVPNFLKCVFPRQQRLDRGAGAGGGGGGDGYQALQNDDDGSEDGDESAKSGESEGDSPKSDKAAPAQRSAGMGSDDARFNTHSSMMDRNGSISERYKRLKQSRSLSLVERLRQFSLDDLDVSIEVAASEISDSFDAKWLDEDDQTGRGRAMRVKQNRSRAGRLDASTPYGAVEQDDFQCDLLTFETKKPSWNEELGAWTLNFKGRVKVASKKNFLLVAEQGNEAMEHEFTDETAYLRFGKVSKTRFTLDYMSPFSPMLALAVAASSFAHKIAVT